MDFDPVTFDEAKKKGKCSRNSLFKGCPETGRTVNEQIFPSEPVRGDAQHPLKTFLAKGHIAGDCVCWNKILVREADTKLPFRRASS